MHESRALNELVKHYHENRLAHAFLIETNDQETCYKNLITFLKMLNCPNSYEDECSNCQLCHLLNSENLPSLIKIIPDGASIKKEQVLELKRFFQTRPTFSKYNMYIIMNAELLNSSSANTMLKFIEEPEDNIIGFFITNNKENIIDTIKSRCQIVSDFYINKEMVDIPKVWQSIAVNYVKECEMTNDEAILYNKNVLVPLIHDRRELLFLFQSIFSIYNDLYHKSLDKTELREEYKDLNFVLKKGKIYLSLKLSKVLKILDELNYNLNISLVLDKFVLEGSNE